MTPSSDAIFFVGPGGDLERVPLAPYSSEDLIQELVARYPDLLAGDQINRDDPPSWLLVTREAGIPDSAGASVRWSADHLLLDQHGVPTFIEVKRSSDTRIRREVIGQMLEYAANASQYWPVDRIRTLASQRLGGPEFLDQAVRDFAVLAEDDPEGVEQYWRTVDANLRRGPLRLLFVADELSRELRRVIEFLNEHMPQIEVLGIEVRQYSQGALRAFVPRVVGQTERARDARTGGLPATKTSEPAFLDSCSGRTAQFFTQLLSEARERGHTISWGTKGFSVRCAGVAGPCSVMFGYPPGSLGSEFRQFEVYLKHFPESTANTLRAAILQLRVLRESGHYTLRAIIDDTTAEGAREAFELVLNAAPALLGVEV